MSGEEVQQQTIQLSSSGGYTASDLSSTQADIQIRASGSARLQVSDTCWRGYPPVVSLSITGALHWT